MNSQACAAFVAATPLAPSTHHRASVCVRHSARCSVADESSRPRVNMLTELARRVRHDIQLTERVIGNVVASTMLATLLTLSPTSVALAELPSSVPSAPLFDDASAVNKGNQQLFNRAADAMLTNTGYRVHFVVLPSLPFGQTPTEYAADLAAQWGLGDKDVLFVSSVKLSRAGCFVGADEQLQRLLTPDVAKSIAEETYAVAAADERVSSAVLDVSNRLIPVLGGEKDPGPPVIVNTEVVQTFKTKQETKNDRSKYIKVVGGVLVISIIAPLVQTYWYVRDD